MASVDPGIPCGLGLFDSGSGGLSVYRALEKRFPDFDYVYLADHARCPFGDRSSEEVYEATQEGVTRLFEKGCRIVILACNTATTIALRRLQQTWLPTSPYADRRILGIVVPTLEALESFWQEEGSPPGVVAVFATIRTVLSGVYKTELKKYCPDLPMLEQACSELAGSIENGAPENVLKAQIEEAWNALLEKAEGRNILGIVLGCTHYALIEPLFRKVVPKEVHLFSQSDLTLRRFEDYTGKHSEFSFWKGSGKRLFLTTGSAKIAQETALRLLGEALPFQEIEK